MEANGKLATNFVELLNGYDKNAGYSLEINYEKPEVGKKNLCNGFNLKSLNGTCPMKQQVSALAENGCPMNGHLNGHANGHVNGHLDDDSNGSDDSDNCNKENGNHKKPLHYQDYLMLDKLLSCQEPITRRSRKGGEAHDEHLFIVTHQSYEIWFKQVLYELSSVQKLIKKKLDTKNTGNNFTGEHVVTIKDRLKRMCVIFKHLVNQWEILETMDAQNFVEFRSYLKPASGFQSLQFRLMENKLGVRNDLRVSYGKCNYVKAFHSDNNKINSIKSSETEQSLHDLIEQWLEREATDQFLASYMKAVNRMLDRSKTEIARETDVLYKDELTKQYSKNQQLFDQLTNEQRYAELVKRGDRRLSFRAFKSALCVFVNKENPRYNTMYEILCALQDIDTLINKWRANHVNIVLKMIGTDLMGTGGSSGYQYLRSTLTDRYKIFTDFFNLSGYIVEKVYMIDYDYV